jgi:3-oxoadipate enol-lactonase
MPAVLLIHGYPLGAWMWERQARTLAARGYEPIVPDLRGFGASPLPPRACTIDDYAADLATTLDERKVRGAAVVGLSMGGYVALALVERRPDLVGALVLSNTRAGADSEEGKKGRTATAEKARKEGARPIAETMAQKLFAPGTPARNPGLVADTRSRMEKVSPEAIACALLAMRDRPDRTALLRSIRVPTLVITGAEDGLIPPAESEAMRAAIPGAELVTVPGAGHLPNLEVPEAYDRALLAFLDHVLPPGGRTG